jgi:hypothetical protein
VTSGVEIGRCPLLLAAGNWLLLLDETAGLE